MKKKIRNIVLGMLSDRFAIRLFYFWKFGKFPDLKNPKTLNEKIQWLKLHDRSELHTICADKLAVREYVEKKIGGDYLIPLVYKTDNVQDLSLNVLPEYPVIIKSNHNSGDYFIIRDTHSVDIKYLKKRFSKSLKTSYYKSSKEWQYRDIKPHILIEKLLLTRDGEIPEDYKVHCFNGKPVMVQIDINRGKINHARNWYTTNWERMPFKWSSKYKGRYTDPVDEDVQRPDGLDQMLKLSEILAEEFIYSRIDFYFLDGKIYFGEITFHHDGGFACFKPKEYDTILGKQLNIYK